MSQWAYREANELVEAMARADLLHPDVECTVRDHLATDDPTSALSVSASRWPLAGC